MADAIGPHTFALLLSTHSFNDYQFQIPKSRRALCGGGRYQQLCGQLAAATAVESGRRVRAGGGNRALAPDVARHFAQFPFASG